MNRQNLNIIVFFLLFTVSCKVLPTKPYLAKEAKIEFTADNQLTKEEKDGLRNRLFNVQDDSVKVTIKDHFFLIHNLKNPIVYDTAYSRKSARNMEASLRHLGYYKAKVTDTAYFNTRRPYRFNIFKRSKKVTEVNLKYTVSTNITTRIESFNYRLKDSALQKLANSYKDKSYVKVQEPVTKTAILSEIARLVDSFRNNGYYKFTASELRMRGDSSIAALTNISDDPIEQLEALIEAEKKKDSPTIKLALVIVKPEDSTKLNRYTINKIYVISDFRQGDNVASTKKFYFQKSKEFGHYFHNPLFKTALIERNLTLKTGNVFRQNDFYNSINNLTKLGVWQNVNIRLIENFDSANKLDVVLELTPAKKLTPAFTLDLNYSAAGANNNGFAGNLFGTSLNFSIENKNFAKEAIKMVHNFRFGIEFRGKNNISSDNLIQSNEVGYSNDVSIPKLFYPSKYVDPRYWFYCLNSPKSAALKYKTDKKETFLNTTLSYSNRIFYFNLQNIGLAYGYRSKNAKNNIFTFNLLNAQYSYLYNKSPAFDDTLRNNPFLRYSYNTAFVIGLATSYTSTKKYITHSNKREREGIFRIAADESGLTWGLLSKNEILKKYVKVDAEFKYNNVKSNKKNSFNLRGFVGVGIPLSNNDALPFFKQFAGGGSSSMRGWPIRGIGRGAQALIPNTSSKTFNDRTGDIQLELNVEHRHFITKIYTDLITLKGALFIDAGNIWNFKESFDPLTGQSLNTQFKFKNLAKEIGVSAGYGFRIDFTYLVLRTDFGFRIKRPETSNIRNGLKWPDMSFDDIFQKILSKDYRQWRYENFNFSFGINYPF